MDGALLEMPDAESLGELEAQLHKRLFILHVSENGSIEIDPECVYAPHELIGWAAFLEAEGYAQLSKQVDENE